MVRLFKRLMFLSVAFTQVVLPMAQPAMDQARIDQAVQRADEVVARMPEILGRIPETLQRMQDRERERKAEQAARNAEAVANQNTILFSTPLREYQFQVHDYDEVVYDYDDNHYYRGYHRVPHYREVRGNYPRFAFFKRDLITGAVFLANMASDVAMYKLIKKFRIQRITEYLLEHHQEVENLLTHIKNELLKIDYKVEDKAMTEKEAAAEKKKVIALVKTFVEAEHTLQNAFFNKEMIAIILGRLAIEKVADALEGSLITNKVPVNIAGFDVEMPLPPCAQASYEYNAAGERVQCQDYPISMVSVIRTINALLFNSADMGRIFMADLPDMMGDGLKYMNGMLGLGIPKFVFDPKVKMVTRFASQVAGLAFAVKIFDTQSHAGWVTHIEKNHAELLPLLQEYKALKNSSAPEDLKKLKAVEEKIAAFVASGHAGSWFAPGADCKTWFRSKIMGGASVNLYKNIALYGFLALKGYQLYRHFTASGNPAAA